MNHLFHLLKKTGFYVAAFVFVITGLFYMQDQQSYQAQLVATEHNEEVLDDAEDSQDDLEEDQQMDDNEGDDMDQEDEGEDSDQDEDGEGGQGDELEDDEENDQDEDDSDLRDDENESDHEGRQDEFLDLAKKRLERLENLIDELSETVDEEQNERWEMWLEDVEELFEDIEELLEENDPEAIPLIRELTQLLKDMTKELGLRSDNDQSTSRREFVRRFNFKNADSEAFMERVVDRLSDRILRRLDDKIDPEVLEELLPEDLTQEDFEEALESLLEFTDVLDDEDADRINRFLSRQGRIWDRLERVSERLENIQERRENRLEILAELQDLLRERLREYRFPEQAGQDVQEAIDAFLTLLENEELEDEEIEAAANELKDQISQIIDDADLESIEEGLAVFRDAVSQWFTEDSIFANKRGYILGEDGMLNPGRDVIVAEALTAFGRLAKVNTDLSVDAAIEVPEWAEPFATGLEAEGVDLVGIFEGKTGANVATRGEAAELIATTFNLTPGPESLLDQFSDINPDTDDEDLLNAIQAVVVAGIMTGEGEVDENGQRQFNSDGTFNRAMLARVIRLTSLYLE